MPATAKRAKPTHPSYAAMIKEAIVTLKERTGSSRQALRKFIGAKYKLPDGWEKKLSLYLKKMALDGALVQVKASYKLGEKLKKAPAKPKKVKAATVKTAPKAAAPRGMQKTVGKKRTAPTRAKGEAKKKVPGTPAKSKAKTVTKRAAPKAKKPVKKAPAASQQKKKPAKASRTSKRTAAAATKK